MKITDVACHILQCKVDKPFTSARGWLYGTRASCVLEFEQTPNPLRDHLAQEPVAQKTGIAKGPTGPGLGIEIDREVLKEYKVA
jgi:hypothetical protein